MLPDPLKNSGGFCSAKGPAHAGRPASAGAGRHALAQSLRAGDLQRVPTPPAPGPRAVMDVGSSPGHGCPLIWIFEKLQLALPVAAGSPPFSRRRWRCRGSALSAPLPRLFGGAAFPRSRLSREDNLWFRISAADLGAFPASSSLSPHRRSSKADFPGRDPAPCRAGGVPSIPGRATPRGPGSRL